MNALEIAITRKAYPARADTPEHLAVAELSFTVKEGEFVCILGPSGCGKTTLLNLIASLDGDYEGRIALAKGIEDHLTYMFQTPRLLPWRTVRQNIGLAIDDTTSGPASASDLISAVGLEAFADAYPGQLSLGMQRRAALARAFARNPRMLLMDEPFVSLDDAAADRLRALLARILGERPATVLFVTHDRREAAKLADRILIFSDAPATLAGDIPVKLSRVARTDPARIEAFCRKYLPQIAPKSDDADTASG